MSKLTYTVKAFTDRLEFTRHLRTAVVTFMLMPVAAMAMPEDVSYRMEENTATVVETVMAGQSVSMNQVMTATTALGMADTAFNQLVARVPEALEMEPVADFITGGIGNIEAERVVMDCDKESKVLNVAYRLSGDILLSVSKPLETMDDEFVMFNVYHLRDLLVSDTARIDLLAQYVRNVESRIAEQA